jgi:hypothetical protein
MDGVELRRRLNRLGTPYVRLAPRLGLSVHGLRKQMNGQRPVSRQTEVILETLEKNWIRRPDGKPDGRTERTLIRRPGG